jgi:ubiquinone/menaquinone biosynthesis C-methylase UbiE
MVILARSENPDENHSRGYEGHRSSVNLSQGTEANMRENVNDAEGRGSPARDIYRALEHLRCPDDRSKLHAYQDSMVCGLCGREFKSGKRSTLDLLPLRPTALQTIRNVAYVDSYLRLFQQPFASEENCDAWGADEKTPPGWAEGRMRQVKYVLPIVLRERGKTLCDVSGGAGRYTLEYAKHFDLVFHCDLASESLNYVSRKASTLGLRNVISLRTDYLRLPFYKSVDVVICFDSLIRGEEHERLLLESIKSSVAPGGIAVIDFHNWWHNPLRRVGLLKQNFGENRSYSRREVEALLSDVGISRYQYLPFVQEFLGNDALTSLARKLIPATRLIYWFQPDP